MNATRSALPPAHSVPLHQLSDPSDRWLVRCFTGAAFLLLCSAAPAAVPVCTWTTLVGSALNPGYADGTNSVARFYNPEGIAVDAAGALYVADFTYSIIRKLTPAGTNWIVTTIAGTATNPQGSVDGTNGAASFRNPAGITIDNSGNLFVADSGNNTIRRITTYGTNWVVTTIAGSPPPTPAAGADGTNNAARFSSPQGIAVDANGTLYVADVNNNSVRKITPVETNWVVTTVAGSLGSTSGFDDGTNGAARFYHPLGVGVDSNTNLYVVDSYNGTLRKITPYGTNWVVSTIAGNHIVSGYADGTNAAASFSLPNGLALDGIGNLYVADGFYNIIRQVSPVGTNWVVTTIGGSATNSAGSADGTNSAARFKRPWGIASDGSGNLYVTDYNNYTVRRGVVPVPPSAPIIKTVGRSGANINFTWSAVTGRTYQVLYRTNLAQTVWSNLGSSVVANYTTMTNADSTGSGPRRFYRVALLP
jgi:hypothetical protein